MKKKNVTKKRILVFEYDRIFIEGFFIYVDPMGSDVTLCFSLHSIKELIKTILSKVEIKGLEKWLKDNVID